MFSLELISSSKLEPHIETEEDFQYTFYDVPEMKLWKLVSSCTEAYSSELPILQPSRTNVVFIHSIPSFMSNLDVCKYVKQFTPIPFKVTFFNYIYRSAAVEFSNQEGADCFYINTLGELFDSDRKSAICISLFLLNITPNVGIHFIPTDECSCDRELTLPLCPLCFELFESEITSLFTMLNLEDILSEKAYFEWGESNCPVCSKLYAKNHNFKCQAPDCSETEKLWICMECGFIGCGREKNKHSLEHFRKTRHRFSLCFESALLWDYISDRMVTRFFPMNQSESVRKHVLALYKQNLLNNITPIRLEYESEIDRIREAGQKEIEKLKIELNQLVEMENDIEPQYKEVKEISDKIDQVTQQIIQINNSPEFLRKEELLKKNRKLSSQLNTKKKDFQNLCEALNQKGDVSNVEYEFNNE